MPYLVCLLVVCAAATCVARASAQEPKPLDRTGALRVFLDCNSCDENHLRTEITYVNYVRDRADADVHVLVTTQDTGGGGTEYTLKYIGLQRFASVEQVLKYVSASTNTDDERRRGFATTFALGLVRYVAETPLASRIKVSFDAPKEATTTAAVRDPWNFWIFRVQLSGNFSGQESQSERNFDAEVSASRTTEAWKIDSEIEYDYGTERFTLEEGEEFTSIRRELDARGLVVKSVNDHWSVGGVGAVFSSIFRNYDLRTRVAPGIEYDWFPYADSTRRMLTFLYTIGVETADYQEETVYQKRTETLLDHRFETSLGLNQPWGTASASVEMAQYLNRRGKYRLTTSGGMDVRLFKGFSVGFSAEASRRRDQLSLRRGDASNEEILVRQRELATGYQYGIGFGISYQFGSIYNNVVNPRFRRAGGF